MRSIENVSGFSRLKTFVVDNASSDGSADYVRERYPWAQVLKNQENIGFGRAHNQIIRNVHSRYHIVVNPDVCLMKNTVEDAAAYMDAHADAVVLTPFVLNPDGTQQFLPKRNPTFLYLIGSLLEKRFAFGRKLRDEYVRKNEEITEPTDVEFCTGAFLFARTSALHQVGGFDERYYLHFEDADLTRELRKVGRAVYHPGIRIVHKWNRENRKSLRSFGMALRSMFLYWQKWHGKSGNP